ncbi:DNA repair and recombination protein RadA [miscellaneous Crenarchaeota group-15 archaeon DG-45]|uniref:DNA repair and recombination protein RadA n=1 Tax=miscellaneous Crenarchaeota group-15 archaeon DG-45 TaxID=1685127 RepID=A0A0M0BQ89_9ARCH|nr:MAG: DNA repair and recombination protein RadA [miscellaneous Crenarchaeota group-15 archaeon DG-45]
MGAEQIEYYRAKYKSLEDLPGVGPATASKLREIGFRTVESIATAAVSELVAAGVGEATAEKIIAAARKSIAIAFVRGDELVKLRSSVRQLSTGCTSLDGLLAGGVETQSITEVYGEFGTGKSQLCQQLCVTVQLPIEQGGLEGGALYIDTENTFRPERITQIAPRFGLEPEEALRRIIFAEAYTSNHQMMLLENADEVIKENGIRLIVVDSATSHFRSEYLGREMLAPRQQQLNKHLHKLIRLARAFNAAAVITNQVMAQPDVFFAKVVQPVGGHVMGHTSHTRIFLRKGRNNVRIAKLTVSPFLPEGEAPIRITERGIESDEDA